MTAKTVITTEEGYSVERTEATFGRCTAKVEWTVRSPAGRICQTLASRKTACDWMYMEIAIDRKNAAKATQP